MTSNYEDEGRRPEGLFPGSRARRKKERERETHSSLQSAGARLRSVNYSLTLSGARENGGARRQRGGFVIFHSSEEGCFPVPAHLSLTPPPSSSDIMQLDVLEIIRGIFYCGINTMAKCVPFPPRVFTPLETCTRAIDVQYRFAEPYKYSRA